MDITHLTTIRKAKKITAKQMAKDIGISRQQFSKYEAGTASPTLQTAIKWASLLDMVLILTFKP